MCNLRLTEHSLGEQAKNGKKKKEEKKWEEDMEASQVEQRDGTRSGRRMFAQGWSA